MSVQSNTPALVLLVGALSGLIFFLLEITVRFIYLVGWTTEQAPVGYAEFALYYTLAGAIGGLFGSLACRSARAIRDTSNKTLRYGGFVVILGLILVFAVLLARMAGRTELDAWQLTGHLATVIAGITVFFVIFSILLRKVQKTGTSGLLRFYAVFAGLVIVGHMAFLQLFSWGRVFDSLPDATADTSQANILLLTVDTLRADHLGAYGHDSISPNIDRLAASGTLFENAVATSGWTRPSFGSIMTSTYPSQHGGFVINDPAKDGINETWADMLYNGKLSTESLTFAEIMKRQGYTTIALQSNWQAGSAQNFDQGFDLFLYDALFTIPLWDRTLLGTYGSWVPKLFGMNRRLPFYNTPPNADEVHAVFNEMLKHGLPQPFFLWINLMDPHSPYLQREQGVPIQDAAVTAIHDSWEMDKPVSLLVDAYDTEIRYADYYIGLIVDELEQLQILDNTILAFFSDHGEDFEDHEEPVEVPGETRVIGRHHGHSMYQELLHVPLILRYPAAIPQGRRISKRVCMLDLLPTLLELAGLNDMVTGTTFAGQSFLSAFNGKPETSAQRTCISERTFYGLDEKAVQNNNLKLILRMRDLSMELYDLQADPGEQDNLSARRSKDTQEMRALLDDWMQGMPPEPGSHATESQDDLSEEAIQQLRSLGYIR